MNLLIFNILTDIGREMEL